jgi:hypothetical protein
MKKLIAISLAFGSLAFINGAQAAVSCGPHDKIMEVLNQRFQESRQALGLAGHVAMIELFVSARGSWTMTSTNTQGLTCVIAAGDAWENSEKRLAGLNS